MLGPYIFIDRFWLGGGVAKGYKNLWFFYPSFPGSDLKIDASET